MSCPQDTTQDGILPACPAFVAGLTDRLFLNLLVSVEFDHFVDCGSVVGSLLLLLLLLSSTLHLGNSVKVLESSQNAVTWKVTFTYGHFCDFKDGQDVFRGGGRAFT